MHTRALPRYRREVAILVTACVAVALWCTSCGGGATAAIPDSTNNPVPAITSLSPASAATGSAAQTLTINGTNFLSTSTVTYNSVAHAATFVSATQLTIQLSASDQATAGTYPVVVTNPAPGGGASNSVNFSVTAGNPVPTITSLSPASAATGSAAQTLTINGTNFLSTSTVTYNSVAHAATFVSATQLTIQLSASDQATAGTYAVVVTNPAPGGGASNSVNFSVTAGNPVPTITSLSPASALTGAAAQTLTINGTNFLSTSTVTYNAVAHAATFVSATQLAIQLSTSDQATAGTYAVVVTNPAPGGGASNSVNFSVSASNPVPTIASLSPASATAGAAVQTLTINGTNYLSTSTVTYNSVAHAATFVSSTQLTIQLSASDQATVGTYAVVVTNPAPGGGASNSVNFSVTCPTASLSPSTYAFASQPAATSSSPETFTLSNTGNGTMNIASIGLTPTDTNNFSETTTCGATLAANSSCPIVVLFTPPGSGSFSASLIVTDKGNCGTQSSTLTGTGTHDVILSWTASPTSGIQGYNVYRGTTSQWASSTRQNSTPINGTSYVDGNVTAGATYYYWVTSVGSGDVESAPSTQAEATVPTP